jgi:transposase
MFALADSVHSERRIGAGGRRPRCGGRDRKALGQSPADEHGPSALGSCPEQMMGRKSRMQGKESSEQATALHSSVGIDVSKACLDVHVLPSAETLSVANSREGMRKLKRWLGRFKIGLIVLEATGKLHRAAHRSLFAAGFPVALTDPFRVRCFAKAKGILAKTDRLDAYVLALFGSLMSPDIRPPAPEALQDLAELVRARDSAVGEQTAIKNQLAAANGSFLKRHLERRVARIGKDIEAIAAEIGKRIAADPGLARRYAILISIPSFGPAVATTLVACLSELGSCSRREIALLAGLAPIADQSGKREGKRVIWGGRPALRRSLYLAALSAARCNPAMRAHYQALVDKGKTAKNALIAIARKLVVLANTLIAENRTWQITPPKSA